MSAERSNVDELRRCRGARGGDRDDSEQVLTYGTSTLRPRYGASVWSGDYRSSDLNEAWRSLIPSRDPVSSIYQTPDYFEFLQDVDVGSSQLNVLTIHDLPQDAIVGVVPVRQATIELPFNIRDWRLATLRLKSLMLLGSEPMMPEDPQALDELFQLMSERFPASQVVDLPSLPQQSYLWNYLQTSPVIDALYHIHVIHGFRESHSIDIPASLDGYYGSLTRKRRYNFLRQERLLENHLGAPLKVVVIEEPDRLPELFRAFEALGIPAAHRSLLRSDQYVSAAAHGMLRCFILMAGQTTVGLALGIKWHKLCVIHRFFYERSLAKFSPGTTLWQVILKYLITEAGFTKVDLGYGNPVHRFHATNTIVHKGRVLLFRRTLANRCRILAYSGYTSALNFAKRQIGDPRAE